MEISTVDRKAARYLIKLGIFVGGTLLLVGSWYVLFMLIAAATEAWLVPWDCWPGPERPPLGTWSRAINDFFEVPPGSILPSAVFITVSISIFIFRVVRATERTLLPLALAVTNLLFLVLDAFLVGFAYLLPALWRPPNEVSYHQTWPAMLVTMILLILLFFVQSKVALEKIWQRPR